MAAPRPDSEGYVDKVLGEAMKAATCGIDLNVLDGAIEDGFAALGKMTKELARANYRSKRKVKTTCPECRKLITVMVETATAEVAKAFAAAGRTLDDLVRLGSFARGQADSRPGSPSARGADWLRSLTNEQFKIVQGWIEENDRGAEGTR
jgi:hypothetical protein